MVVKLCQKCTKINAKLKIIKIYCFLLAVSNIIKAVRYRPLDQGDTMIRIAICDDDIDAIDEIRRHLMLAENQPHDMGMEIEAFHSGEDFLSGVEQGGSFSIVFMDIQMGGIDGVETGGILRKTPGGDEVILIYMSSHDSYYEGIAYVGSFGFVKKPIASEKLGAIIGRALPLAVKQSKNRKKVFLYNVNKDIHSVAIDDIAYLKSRKRMVEIYTWDEAKEEIKLSDPAQSSALFSQKALQTAYSRR